MKTFLCFCENLIILFSFFTSFSNAVPYFCIIYSVLVPCRFYSLMVYFPLMLVITFQSFKFCFSRLCIFANETVFGQGYKRTEDHQLWFYYVDILSWMFEIHDEIKFHDLIWHMMILGIRYMFDVLLILQNIQISKRIFFMHSIKHIWDYSFKFLTKKNILVHR